MSKGSYAHGSLPGLAALVRQLEQQEPKEKEEHKPAEQKEEGK
ncbi:hypothetical protein ACFC0X_24935 [Paenibacillus chitinolyticus]